MAKASGLPAVFLVTGLRRFGLILLLALVFAPAFGAHAHTGQAVFAFRAEEAIRVDGSLDDLGWTRTSSSRLRISKENLVLGQAGTGDLWGELLFAWDDRFFYIAMVVNDDLMTTDRIPFELQKQDSIELLFDFKHEGTSFGTFVFAPNTRNRLGPWFSIPRTKIGFSQRQAGTVTRFRQVGYTVELAVPRAAFEALAGVEIKPGLSMGLNVVINKAVPDRGWQCALVWSGSASDWDRAYGFGDIVFMDRRN